MVSRALTAFFTRFLIIFGASQVLLLVLPLQPLQAFLAQLVGLMVHIPADGIYLPLSATARFEVSAFCTGITSAAMLVGLLFGFSIPSLNQKITHSLIGTALLFFVNLLRLALVVYIGHATQSASLAEGVHTFTWFVMSACVFVIWFHGMKKMTHSKDGPALARKLLEKEH